MEIELARAVAALRDELLEAAAEGARHDVTFQVGPIEMEFQVELRQDARMKAGFRAWVVSADADAGVARGRTHRLSFTLTPRGTNGGPLLIAATGDDGIAPRPESDLDLRAR
ncbi:trypco2 family protein [Streptomyces kanasensis]|uniref:trypco2 family protein n=1 Tax=Streptomyces kanasensis TaxID=936756 RepID=UPI0036FD8193